MYCSLLSGIILGLASLTSATDCFQCWNELCSGTASNDISFENRCCWPCGKTDNNCRDLTGALNSQTCCDDAEKNILLLFPRESSNQGRTETCNSARIYYGQLEPGDIFKEDSLSSGRYIMPYFIFNCNGCIKEVLLRVVEDNRVENNAVESVTIELQFWAQHGEPADELYKMRRNVTIYTNEIHTQVDARSIHNAIFKLFSGEACFEEGEILGFSSSGNFKVMVTLSASIYSETNISVYRVNDPSGNNCSNLEDYAYNSSLERLQDSQIAVIDLKIMKPIPSTSVRRSSSMLPTATRSRDPVSSPVATSSVQPTEMLSTESVEKSSSVDILPIVIGAIGGIIAILLLLLVILMAVFVFQRFKQTADNTDGRKISRVRSRRLEQRHNSSGPLPYTSEDPFYDYPRDQQLHHYHELEVPTEMQVFPGQTPISPNWSTESTKYTTMHPIGSVREGGLTPGPSNLPRVQQPTIYDDEITTEHIDLQDVRCMHEELHVKPKVQDTPMYQVLEQPREVNGEMVPQVGYDVPRELVEKSEVKEEIHNPIYNELENGPQQHMQVTDPVTGHPYHMLEENSQKGSEENTIEHGLYVPAAEERKKIYEENSTDISVGDLENWIKRSRIEGSKKRRFFEQTSTYWTPPSEADKLYDTLSKRKYREILTEQLQIIKYIGHGQFGTVNLGKWNQDYVDPMDVAVKVCRSEANEAQKTKFLMEAAIMGQFRHKNVVKLYGVVTMSEQPMIVLELMKHGDLLNYLETNYKPGKYPPPSALRLLSFSQQIAAGMKYLSNKSFVHRDLAARNVMLNDMLQCKIGDFGMARDLEDSEYYIMSKRGPMPLKWTAPEAINFRKYSTFSDCYSYGMVLYEIWSVGRPPLPDLSIKEVPEIVSKGYCQPPPPGCPRAIYSLMVKLWDPKYRSRPPFTVTVDYLDKKDEELLAWSEEDQALYSQVAQLGAPLEESKDLYLTLQNTYQSTWC